MNNYYSRPKEEEKIDTNIICYIFFVCFIQMISSQLVIRYKKTVLNPISEPTVVYQKMHR